MLAVGQVVSLRQELERLGVRVTNEQLQRIVYRTRGDFDLARTALLMNPRPSWVRAIVGTCPPPLMGDHFD
jgi:hypothetical protein